MSEKCGVCGRPKGDYHRRPVAGECTAPDPTDYTVSLQCTSIALRKAQEDIAAAEERGRRAWIEGRRALEAIHEYCLHMFRREWLTDPGNRSIFAAQIFAIANAALAPRDSGKEDRK